MDVLIECCELLREGFQQGSKVVVRFQPRGVCWLGCYFELVSSQHFLDDNIHNKLCE